MVKAAKWMLVFAIAFLRPSSGAALQVTAMEDMTLDSVVSGGCPAWDPSFSIHPIGYGLFALPGRVNRALFHFDLASAGVPPGAQVTSAKLRIYIQDNPGFQFDLAARRVTETRWTEAGAGWNYCDCYAAVPWATPGGDVTQVDEVIVPISGIGYRVMEVDALAQAAIDDEEGQLHVMLSAASESGPQHWVTIGSRENPDPRIVPTLDIEWAPLEVLPTKDKHISSAFGDCSAVIGGTNSTLNLGMSVDKVSQIMRPLLHFDLPAAGVPAGAVVSNATLKMYVNSVIGEPPVKFTANRMLNTGWSEATAGWVYSKCDGATPWSNPYFTTINASEQVDVTEASGSNEATHPTVNVTSLVQDSVSQQGGQVHMALVADTDGQTLHAVIASKDQALKPRPVLKVSFCGDGSQQPSEECDDGNTQDGDGCSAQCLVELPEGCQWVSEIEYFNAVAENETFEWLFAAASGDLGFDSVLRNTVRCQRVPPLTYYYGILDHPVTGETAALVAIQVENYLSEWPTDFTPIRPAPGFEALLMRPVGLDVLAIDSLPFTFHYTVDSTGEVNLEILDRSGQLVSEGDGGAAGSGPPAYSPFVDRLPTCDERNAEHRQCFARETNLWDLADCAITIVCVIETIRAGGNPLAFCGALEMVPGWGVGDCLNLAGAPYACGHSSPKGKRCRRSDCAAGTCRPNSGVLFSATQPYVCDVPLLAQSECDTEGCEQCDGTGACVAQCQDDCDVCEGGMCTPLKDSMKVVGVTGLNGQKISFANNAPCNPQPGCNMHASLSMQWRTCSGSASLENSGKCGYFTAVGTTGPPLCGVHHGEGICNDVDGFLRVLQDVRECAEARGWPFTPEIEDRLDFAPNSPAWSGSLEIWFISDQDRTECDCNPPPTPMP